jgi:hypothetical protein
MGRKGRVGENGREKGRGREGREKRGVEGEGREEEGEGRGGKGVVMVNVSPNFLKRGYVSAFLKRSESSLPVAFIKIRFSFLSALSLARPPHFYHRGRCEAIY